MACESPGRNGASSRRSDKPGHRRWRSGLGGSVDGGRGARDRRGAECPGQGFGALGDGAAHNLAQRGEARCSATAPGTWERTPAPGVLGPATRTRRDLGGAEAGSAMGAVQGAIPTASEPASSSPSTRRETLCLERPSPRGLKGSAGAEAHLYVVMSVVTCVCTFLSMRSSMEHKPGHCQGWEPRPSLTSASGAVSWELGPRGQPDT